MHNILNVLLILILTSCSTMSKNIIKKDDLTISGLVYNDQKLDEEMTFKRTSWYKEMTLNYELLLYKVNSTSPFYSWLTEDEKKTFERCKQGYIALMYTLNSDRISHTKLRTEMDKNGFYHFIATGFRDNLKMHPSYERFNFRLYQVFGFCKDFQNEKANQSDIVIEFPGFKKKIVN